MKAGAQPSISPSENSTTPRLIKNAQQAGQDPSTRINSLLRQIDFYQLQLRIHRQKLAEAHKEVLGSSERFQEVYEQTPIGFLTLDHGGRILNLNEKIAVTLGFSPAWLIRKPFVVFVAKEDVSEFLSYLHRLRTASCPQMLDLTISSGCRKTPFQLTTSVIYSASGLVYRMALADMTDVRNTERELQDALTTWQALFRSGSDGIITVDADGKIVFANRPMWGRTVDQLLHSNIMDYIPSAHSSKISLCLDKTFKTSKRTSCEIPGINGAKESWFSFNFGSVEPMAPAGQQITATTVVIREVSKRKQIEKKLRTSGELMRDFAVRMDTTREEERTRLAREIHDELGQALTVLKLDISWLQGRTPKSHARKIRAILQQVDDTIQSVRRIASELRPSILDNLGLIPAIEWQVQEIQKRTGLNCKVCSNVDGLDLGPERAAAVFRVVQEGLTNVVRHAEASKVEIHLTSTKSFLKMSLWDNGKGMSEPNVMNRDSLGLVGMKERISRFNGQFKIVSGPNKGTRLEFKLPL